MYPDPLTENVFLNQKAWEELNGLEAFRDVQQMELNTETSQGAELVPDRNQSCSRSG
jgi:hypothetical protein